MSSIYLNEVRIIGNVGSEPALRKTTSGMAVLNLSIATTYKSPKSERTDWHRVVLFGVLAEHAARNLRTGSSVMVGGRLSNNKWTDDAGIERFSTEIVGDSMQIINGWKTERSDGADGADGASAANGSNSTPVKQTETEPGADVPF